MDLKKVFGTLLTLLGIAAIVFGAYIFIGAEQEWLDALVVFIVGAIFFSSGIGLLKHVDAK